MTGTVPLVPNGAVVDARYTVEKLLGRGGMGEVYLARERDTERPVALKVLRRRALATPAARERFRREARMLGQLRHDNIVRLYGVGEHGGLPYIATEHIEGLSVDKLVARAGRLEWLLAVHIVNQAAAALAVAHAKGILHRDVKPANLMIGDLGDEAGHVWLLDFGIALTQRSGALTDDSSVVGTPLFMAPEQVVGDPLDARTDVYSLGVTLYVLLTGHPPYATHERPDADASDILDAHCDEAPRPLGTFLYDFPDELATVVTRCLAKAPDDRYPSADDVQAAIHALFRGSLPPEHPLAFALLQARQREARTRAAARDKTAFSDVRALWRSEDERARASDAAMRLLVAAAVPASASHASGSAGFLPVAFTEPTRQERPLAPLVAAPRWSHTMPLPPRTRGTLPIVAARATQEMVATPESRATLPFRIEATTPSGHVESTASPPRHEGETEPSAHAPVVAERSGTPVSPKAERAPAFLFLYAAAFGVLGVAATLHLAWPRGARPAAGAPPAASASAQASTEAPPPAEPTRTPALPAPTAAPSTAPSSTPAEPPRPEKRSALPARASAPTPLSTVPPDPF